jgi:large subunit ribosomal protein L21
MYAVILSGGTQYRVQLGDVLRLETLPAEAGSQVTFNKVLLVGEGEDIKVGAPFIDGSTVVATVRSHGRGDKIRIIKFGRRKHREKWQGHRQNYTEVKIDEINVG